MAKGEVTITINGEALRELRELVERLERAAALMVGASSCPELMDKLAQLKAWTERPDILERDKEADHG